jgi:hypothetical protein
MVRCNSEAVEMLNSEDGVRRLEAILAAYLTDGHYNGIAIGVRNIDPMIFRHLADLGLVKTVFPVRGTGNTWSLGAYFPKRLSEAALSCLEGQCKPTARIKPEVLQRLDIDRFMAWVIEYEGGVFVNNWGPEAMLLIVLCQYEDAGTSLSFPKTCGRVRLSVSETSHVLQDSGITPSQLWLDYVANRFTIASPIGAALNYFKQYQLDITTKAAIDHQYFFYVSYRAARILRRLTGLTLPTSWKHMIMRVYTETLSLYAMRLITVDDIRLIKRVIACNDRNPMKGPYNEYVISSLDQIRELLENTEFRRATNYPQKMQQFRHYFEKRRLKSYATLNTMLSDCERRRLSELENMLKPLAELLAMLRERGTPKGRLEILISLRAGWLKREKTFKTFN